MGRARRALRRCRAGTAPVLLRRPVPARRLPPARGLSRRRSDRRGAGPAHALSGAGPRGASGAGRPDVAACGPRAGLRRGAGALSRARRGARAHARRAAADAAAGRTDRRLRLQQRLRAARVSRRRPAGVAGALFRRCVDPGGRGAQELQPENPRAHQEVRTGRPDGRFRGYGRRLRHLLCAVPGDGRPQGTDGLHSGHGDPPPHGRRHAPAAPAHSGRAQERRAGGGRRDRPARRTAPPISMARRAMPRCRSRPASSCSGRPSNTCAANRASSGTI